jgi:hypothetical protein
MLIVLYLGMVKKMYKELLVTMGNGWFFFVWSFITTLPLSQWAKNREIVSVPTTCQKHQNWHH